MKCELNPKPIVVLFGTPIAHGIISVREVTERLVSLGVSPENSELVQREMNAFVEAVDETVNNQTFTFKVTL